jgi:hypothetical protein
MKEKHTAYSAKALAKVITDYYPEIRPHHAMLAVICIGDLIADDYKVLLGMLQGARERRNAKVNRTLEVGSE